MKALFSSFLGLSTTCYMSFCNHIYIRTKFKFNRLHKGTKPVFLTQIQRVTQALKRRKQDRNCGPCIMRQVHLSPGYTSNFKPNWRLYDTIVNGVTKSLNTRSCCEISMFKKCTTIGHALIFITTIVFTTWTRSYCYLKIITVTSSYQSIRQNEQMSKSASPCWKH